VIKNQGQGTRDEEISHQLSADKQTELTPNLPNGKAGTDHRILILEDNQTTRPEDIFRTA
jgi:hypothetical protein